jgi:predicted GNAT family N-acyltransferase
VSTNDKEFEDALKVRQEVFIEEQQVPEEEEIDQYEDVCTHVVVYDNEQPVAAGRLRDYDGIGKMERICVLASHRNHGLGKVVMDKLEELAKENGFHKLNLMHKPMQKVFIPRLVMRRFPTSLWMLGFLMLR